ncbi:MAG: hypothetical protein AB7N70_32695, partial [Dehalococcoidia bacterium]
MPRRQHVPTAGRSAVAAIPRRRARPLLVAAVLNVVGLLLGVLGFAPAEQGIVQGAPPVAAQPAANDHWMADLSDTIGQRPLWQVITPGSHDAGTFNWGDPVSEGLAQAQDLDITGQLHAGSRYFDIRADFHDWGGQVGPDYWIKHGIFFSTNVRLSQVLTQAATWASQPGHEKEIVIL